MSAVGPRRVTMRDVAAHAGVSVQTVSNVVNGRSRRTSEQTRERVAAAMDTLGYSVDATARGLRSARTRALGFLLLDDDPRYLADPMTDMVIAGAGDVARERGYGLLIQSGEDGLLRPLLERRVDGAIMYLSGDPARRAAHARRLEALGHPAALFGDAPSASLPSVTAANRDGARRLAEHLLDAGHTRIAFVAARTSWYMIEERVAGYRAALAARGVAPLERFHGPWSAEAGEAMAADLLAAPEPPTAIMAANDLLALGVMRCARRRGLRIPEDLAVSGFNDFDFSAFVDPPLTTISLPVYAMGRAAATLVIDRLDGVHAAPPEEFGVDLILRGSAP
jgi:DNA-binding LacI/PurR family transcriptional regulator